YPQPQRRSTMYVRRGYEAVFVGWDRESRFRNTESIDGVECHYLMRGGGYHSLRAAAGLLRWMNRLFWLALRADVDAIHAFDLATALPVALACRLRRLPLIYDVFDNYELRYRWPEPVRQCIAWIDGWVVRGSAAVIVQDENRIVGGIAAAPEKVTPIYPCPPDYGRPRYTDGREPFSVYAMGFLGTRRGLGLLLESAKALPPVRFLLAGNIHEPGLKSLGTSLPNVRYSGYLSWEAATELAWESDLVFAFFDPSYEINRRAAPQKLYETMMVGRPVLINSETMRAAWV